MDKENTKLGNNLLGGWKRFFGLAKPEVKVEPKPLPKNRFFKPEELEFLSKAEDASLLEKWAVRLGHNAYMSSSGLPSIEYNAVMWSNGLLASWVDGEQIFISDSEQAELLSLLKKEGYVLSDKQEEFVKRQEMADLVGKTFEDRSTYLHVDGVSTSCDPTLTVLSYNKDSMVVSEIPVELKEFQTMMGRGEIKPLSESGNQYFSGLLEQKEEYKRLFNEVIKDIHHNGQPRPGGNIRFDYIGASERHDHSPLGSFISDSWKFVSYNHLQLLGYFGDDRMNLQTRDITPDSNYKYIEFLEDIDHSVKQDNLREDIVNMFNALARQTKDGLRLSLNDGSVVSINTLVYSPAMRAELVQKCLSRMDELSLQASNKENEQARLIALTAFNKFSRVLEHVEGSQESAGKLIFSYQQEKGIDDRRVTNLNGFVSSVRDYLETLKDKDNVLSGDYIDHLPEDRELYTLYDRYEKLEAELDSARFGLPYSKEDRDNLMQQRNEAKSKFEDRLVGILKNFSQDGQVLVKDDKVQGLENYRRWDIETIVHDFFNERFEGVDDAPTPGLIEIYGSRGRGTAHDGSDLDVVVEYEGDWKEDAVFNILHEEPLEIDGINVDINPITKGQTGSMRKFMERSREYDSQVLSGQKPRFSLASTGDMQDLDREYLEAVESGDMEKAQRMVNAAAASKGYSSISSYQGTSAFNGAAPWGNGYFNTPEERKEAWESDSEHLEYEGDQTLADYIENGVNAMSLDYVALDPRFYRATNEERKEAILNVRNVIQSKSDTITMYRSVPSTVKEESFRNGDWITPSKQYAIENAAVHGWGDEYRIIEQEVPTSEIWWDGNDIAEWGYGREEDYVNDRDFAYKNTANNKKSLDAVTYDDEGKVIPLSQRYNENVKDIRYQGVTGEAPLTRDEVELRDTLVGKLRSSGIEVITDVREGQHVLDAFKENVRHQTVFHGSSASFDHFDHSYMGNGEGNQSIGWGTYVSQNEDVSRFYAEMTEKQNSKTKYFFKDKEITWDTPSSMSMMFVFHSIENQEMTAKEAIDKQLGFLEDNYKKGLETGIFLGGKEVLERDIPLLRSAKPEDFRTEKPTVAKNLYTVEIPDDNKENYIDFDAPLTPNQLQVVRSGIKDKPWYEEKDFADMGETTGGKIYDRIASHITPRETSNLLSELGFKGMKAPVGYFLKQADSDKYNYVIFKEDDLKIKDHVRYFKSKEGESYGFTVDGKIYVDPRIATAETPIHEYTHLWATALQKGNPKEWSNVVSLMKDTSVWNEVRENYKDLKTDDEIADEVLATYSGRRGAEKLRQMQADIKNSDAPAARKAGLQKGIYRIIMALDKFWKSVSSFLGTHYESAEQVADRALRDMLHGINPVRQLGEFNAKRDLEYLQAVKSGDIGKAYSMVVGQADMMLADNPMPDNTDAYSLRTDSVPGKTIKVYKTFTLDKDGDPTAMYVSGKDKLPMGVWLDAKDSWHFTAANGKQYVPSTKNPNGRGNRTGTSVPIPSDEVRQQLIERGFLPKDSKASSIVALAYRPGWHAADLPYFPQGGKQDPESNYGHVHRHNQVVFECELDAGTDYTDQARNQSKAFTKAGKLNLRDADLQWMPSEGFYQYTTNQFLPDEEKGHWYIGGSMRINRALTQEECDRILAENGKPAQEWQQGHLDLAKLGYVSSMSHVKTILSPVAFYEDGNIVPLSERFKTFKEEMEPKAIAKNIYDPRKEIPSVRGEWTKDKVLSRKIRFMFVGEKGATSLDLSEKQSMDDVGKRMSLLNLAKSMNQDDKDARLIKSITGWELGADGDWRYEIPDIKGFDWNGNLNFEREHPDYHRYKELVEKDNRYSWLEGDPLTAEEQAECDNLSRKYASLALKKLDDSHTLDAYIEAPDLFKAYPELKKVEMRFEPLDSDYLAQYSRSRSIYDYMTGGDATKSIVINTNKLCMVTDQATLKSVLSHEMQHAVQDIEGFAQGGNIGEVRKSVENVIKENQWSSEYAKAKLNEWSRIKLLEINLGRYERLIKSDNPKIRETAAQYYGDALNFISDNPKSELVIDWDRYGDKNFVEMAETGYYVEDAKKELGRLATLTDFEQKIIPKGNMNSLQIVNKMESVLEEQSDDEMYWNLAGEVESRNVQNRMNMTEEQRKNSLASETEDVERKDQLVILSKPTYAGLNLVPKADGRWHTEKNELRDTYAMYGKMIADYLSTFNKDLEVIPWNQQEQVIIDGNGKPYEGVNAIMLGLDYNNRYLQTQLPIYITEEEIEKNGYGKFPSSKPFPIIVDGKTTEVYHVSGLALKAGVVTPGLPDSELKAEYENWKRLNTPLIHSLKAFPIENYPELGVKTKLGASDDNNYGASNYYREVTHALIEASRSNSKAYAGNVTKGERGKEVLIQNLASSVLGRKYGYTETDGPRDRLRFAAHLERDPKFAEDVLKEAAKTSKGVGDFIEDAVQSWGEDKKLDLRSLTPGEVDLDGNGVVDSQENLAPDTKQDESVTQEKTHERSHGLGRGR